MRLICQLLAVKSLTLNGDIMKTSSDYKLILMSDNEGKAQIRYRKNGDAHFTTLYLDETDFDKIIDRLTEKLK